MKFHIASIRWGMACSALLAVAGCYQTESIQTYEIAKDRSGLDEFEVQPPAASESSAIAHSHRMVVAILEHGSTAWFFKLGGAPADVAAVEPLWEEFLASVHFDDQGQPVWTLPEGWTEGAPAPMRFATVIAPAPGGTNLEVKVSSLSAGQDWGMNVNRWRGQLGLPPAGDAASLLSEQTIGKHSFLMFDQIGSRTGGGAMRGLPAAGRGPMAANPPAVANRPPAFDVPEGWSEIAAGPVADARLERRTDTGTAQITVTRLPAAANDWPSNAARWAREVGGPNDPEALQALTQTVEVDGVEGRRLTLTQNESSPRATIGVMVVQGDTAWFFKLTGDRDVVVASADDFDRLIQSVKFP